MRLMLLAVLALAACQRGDDGQVAALKAQVQKLEERVAMLEKQLAEAEKEEAEAPAPDPNAGKRYFAWKAAFTQGVKTDADAARLVDEFEKEVTRRAPQLQESLDREILDDNGKIIDPHGLTMALQRDYQRRYGKDALRIAQQTQNFGPATGAAFMGYSEAAFNKALAGSK